MGDAYKQAHCVNVADFYRASANLGSMRGIHQTQLVLSRIWPLLLSNTVAVEMTTLPVLGLGLNNPYEIHLRVIVHGCILIPVQVRPYGGGGGRGGTSRSE